MARGTIFTILSPRQIKLLREEDLTGKVTEPYKYRDSRTLFKLFTTDEEYDRVVWDGKNPTRKVPRTQFNMPKSTKKQSSILKLKF